MLFGIFPCFRVRIRLVQDVSESYIWEHIWKIFVYDPMKKDPELLASTPSRIHIQTTAAFKLGQPKLEYFGCHSSP